MGIKLSKKLILIIILVLVLVVLVVLIYFSLSRLIIKPTGEKPFGEIISGEEKIRKQLEFLQSLPQPLSEEEIEKQIKELKQAPQPLSEEEINKQLEELNK